MDALSDKEIAGVYYGSRGGDFRELIEGVLALSGLSKSLYDRILDEEGMRKFSAAFTHPSASDLETRWSNYEWAEFKGDSIANHAVVEYIDLRFPQFDGDSDAVRVGTRLKINLVSKATFCELARGLGFWRFISAAEEVRGAKMRPLLEDCFEAFLGTLSHLVDRKCRRRDKKGRVQLGGGFQFCFDIVREVLDRVPICGGLPNSEGVQLGRLDYDDLVDWITQLKELFDLREVREQMGVIKYSCHREDGRPSCYARTEAVLDGRRTLLGVGEASLQSDAKQAAAKRAVLGLRAICWDRPMRPAYAKYCDRSHSDSAAGGRQQPPRLRRPSSRTEK